MLYTKFIIDVSNYYDVDYIIVDNEEIRIWDSDHYCVKFIAEYKNEYEFELYNYNLTRKYSVTIQIHDGHNRHYFLFFTK
jgi:hypothetical protein